MSTFTEKLMTYALGRGLELRTSLRCAPLSRSRKNRTIRVSGADNCYRKSPHFQMRRTGSSNDRSTNKALNRRTFLRGLGDALALPLLDSMVPARAGAAAKPIIRLGFVYMPMA